MDDAKEMYEMGHRLCEMAKAMGYDPESPEEDMAEGGEEEMPAKSDMPMESPSKGAKAAIIIALKKKMSGKGGE